MDQTLVYIDGPSRRVTHLKCAAILEGLSVPPTLTTHTAHPKRCLFSLDPSYTPLGLRISAKVCNNQCCVILNIWVGWGGGSRRQEIHSINVNVLVFQCRKYTVRSHEG